MATYTPKNILSICFILIASAFYLPWIDRLFYGQDFVADLWIDCFNKIIELVEDCSTINSDSMADD
jgi:hypothetical protein